MDPITAEPQSKIDTGDLAAPSGAMKGITRTEALDYTLDYWQTFKTMKRKLLGIDRDKALIEGRVKAIRMRVMVDVTKARKPGVDKPMFGNEDERKAETTRRLAHNDEYKHYQNELSTLIERHELQTIEIEITKGIARAFTAYLSGADTIIQSETRIVL